MAQHRLSAEDIALYMIDVGQQKEGKNRQEPNDRRCSPTMAQMLRRMDPIELDRLLRNEDEDE